jgi:hypothetical protein
MFSMSLYREEMNALSVMGKSKDYIPLSEATVHLMDSEIGIRRIEYIIERGMRLGLIDDTIVFATRRYSLALLDECAYILDKYNRVLHKVML